MAVKKFLDANGVAYLARLLDNYPDNDLLGTVITAIQEALEEKVNITDEETMANVKAMLSKYALNTTTIYTEPNADTATADGTVLPE